MLNEFTLAFTPYKFALTTNIQHLLLSRMLIKVEAVRPPFNIFGYVPGHCARGSRGGAVVRALASHQCGPGSIPRLGVICVLKEG